MEERHGSDRIERAARRIANTHRALSGGGAGAGQAGSGVRGDYEDVGSSTTSDHEPLRGDDDSAGSGGGRAAPRGEARKVAVVVGAGVGIGMAMQVDARMTPTCWKRLWFATA